LKTWNIFRIGDETDPLLVDVELLEGPAHLIFANRAFWWCAAVCSWLHKFKFPKFILSQSYEKNYGDSPSALWHIFVEMPVLRMNTWAENQPKLKESHVKLSLADAEAQFGVEKVAWIREQIAEDAKRGSSIMR